MTAVLADALWSAQVVQTGGGEVERWTSPGRGHIVEFPVHEDTTARLYLAVQEGEGLMVGNIVTVATCAAELADVLPAVTTR